MKKLIIIGNKTNKLISFLKQAKNNGFKAELVAVDYDDSNEDELKDKIELQNTNIKQLTSENKKNEKLISKCKKENEKLISKCKKEIEKQAELSKDIKNLNAEIKKLKKSKK